MTSTSLKLLFINKHQMVIGGRFSVSNKNSLLNAGSRDSQDQSLMMTLSVIDLSALDTRFINVLWY